MGPRYPVFETKQAAVAASGINANLVSTSKPGWQRFNCPQCHNETKRGETFAIRVDISNVQFKCHRCGHNGFHIISDGATSGTVEKPVRVEKIEHDFLPEHEKYLERRGILKAAIKTGVRSASTSAGEAIIFPYGNGWSKSYNLADKDNPWRQSKPKNAHLPLWRMSGDAPEEILITEGEWDCLSAIEAGYDNAFSLPDGGIQPGDRRSAKEHGKLACIRDDWDQLKNTKKVILALDNDAVGNATADALIELFGRWRCATIQYPKHERATGLNGCCKDLNEVLKIFGVPTVARIIKQAKPLKLEGVFKPEDIRKPPPRRYLDIGISGLSELVRVWAGELFVLTGITNHGKTQFLFDMLGRLVEEHGLKIGLGAFEADYWNDIVPWYGDWLFPGGKPEDWEARTHDWLNEHFVIISHQIEPLGKQASVEWFLQQAADAKGRHQIDALALDPWNKVQHQRKPGESEPDYIGRALSEIRNFAQCHGCISIVTAHPTKETHQGDEVKMPNLSQIHGAMNWGNMADHVVVIFRPDLSKTDTVVSVQKVRYQPMAGKPGLAWLVCRNNRYEKMADQLRPML